MVRGSNFSVLEDSQCPGIQIADIVLWLYAQFRKGKELPSGCLALLEYIFEHGWESDFSFAGVEREYLEKFDAILSKPFPPEEEAKARAILERLEEGRRASMAQYEKDGLPPFLRTSAPALESDSKTDAESR